MLEARLAVGSRALTMVYLAQAMTDIKLGAHDWPREEFEASLFSSFF